MPLVYLLDLETSASDVVESRGDRRLRVATSADHVGTLPVLLLYANRWLMGGLLPRLRTCRKGPWMRAGDDGGAPHAGCRRRAERRPSRRYPQGVAKPITRE